jgi:hypothetical protein
MDYLFYTCAQNGGCVIFTDAGETVMNVYCAEAGWDHGVNKIRSCKGGCEELPVCD